MIISEILSNKITKVMEDNQIIKSELYPAYQFCFEYIFDIIIYNASIIIIGYLLHSFFLSLLYITIMTPLRKFSGGIHAPTKLLCSILSFSIYFSVIFLSNIDYQNYFGNLRSFNYSFVLLVVYFISVLLIIIISPVVHPNKPIDNKNKTRLKSLLILTLAVISIFFLYFTKKGLQKYYLLIIMCIIIVLISLILGKRIYRRESNES